MGFRRLFQPRYLVSLRNYCSKNADSIPVYSKEGDDGTSKTLTGKVLLKDHKVFEAIGTTEELLSHIGLVREYAIESEHEYADKLKRIQTILIDLCTAISRWPENPEKSVQPSHTKELEDWIHEYAKDLPPRELYIIPGGGIPSASLHVARTVCRRAERLIVSLFSEKAIDKDAIIYLNRLSDFLFTLSRIAAKLEKRAESIYIPKPDEKIQAQQVTGRTDLN